MKIKNEFTKFLQNKKNLLAFSSGVDSSALFFLLLDLNIPFDVACVNYQTRKNSDKEALHVKNLAKKHGKISYIHTCRLEKSNFEHNARKVRYDFFQKIISKHKYQNLLLAHQLDDRFEWFMMQMCKGAGISELSGFKPKEKRQDYFIIRPLYEHTKQDLKSYLDENNLPYFEDESNEDTRYKRNFFRKHITSNLLKRYEKGIKKSLEFIAEDAKILDGDFCFIEKELFVYKIKDDKINIRLIDKAIKKLGFIMSEKSRKEALNQNAVINHKIAIGRNQTHGFIAPYIKIVMDKDFKEKCRIAKIPKHIRGYMYREKISTKAIHESDIIPKYAIENIN